MGSMLTLPLAARRARATSKNTPRYCVLLFLKGGIDPILTLDPRQPNEIAPGVALPYAPSAIVERDGRRLGPHFAPLLEHLHELAIVKGVRTNTAAHDVGSMQLTRLKTNVLSCMPSFLEVVGEARAEQPIGSFTLGGDLELYSPGWLGNAQPDHDDSYADKHDVFDQLQAMAPADVAAMARALSAQERSVTATAGAAQRPLVDQLDAGAKLMRDVPRWSKFTPVDWSPAVSLSRRLQRVLWALENDISRCAVVDSTGYWDSHEDGDAMQEHASHKLLPLVARFFAELKLRRNRYGSLADQTVVVIGSEMGRMPFLNHRNGKDHLPQISLILRGPGIRAGSFGVTGSQMEALGVSRRTGGGGTDQLMLDDVGTTLLRMFDISPEPRGYTGRDLDFLRA